MQERMGLHSDLYVNDKVNYPINITYKITSMSWTRTSMEKTLVRLFEKVTGRPLIIYLKNRMVLPKGNWDNPMTAHLTDDAYGLLIFLYNFGAMPSDGVDVVFKLVCPNGSQMTTWLGEDYSQETITFRCNGVNQTAVDKLAASAKEFFN
jgi:hypothetical protein